MKEDCDLICSILKKKKNNFKKVKRKKNTKITKKSFLNNYIENYISDYIELETGFNEELRIYSFLLQDGVQRHFLLINVYLIDVVIGQYRVPM